MIKKRLIMIFAALMICGGMWAQGIFTVVYATSDDGFVNMRAKPSTKARVVGKLWMGSHGLGDGVLCGESGKWSRVRVGTTEGWCLTKYVGKQTWYSGTHDAVLIATNDETPIYREDYDDDDAYPLFTTVRKGTILADDFLENSEFNPEYYILQTAHDCLFIRKSDAEVIKEVPQH